VQTALMNVRFEGNNVSDRNTQYGPMGHFSGVDSRNNGQIRAMAEKFSPE
jgi:hypothetical protein